MPEHDGRGECLEAARGEPPLLYIDADGTPRHVVSASEIADEIAEKVAARLAAQRDDRPLFTIESLAERLSSSPRTVADRLARGEIPSFMEGGKRKVDPAAVDAYLDRLRKAS